MTRRLLGELREEVRGVARGGQAGEPVADRRGSPWRTACVFVTSTTLPSASRANVT